MNKELNKPTTSAEPTTIQSLVEAYRQGALEPKAFLKQKLDRIRSESSNAWLAVISDEQLDDYLARLSQPDANDLPLYGVPFAIKDNIDLEGLETTAGCDAYRYQPKESAFIVKVLIAAGAVPLGKTNLDQFATGLVGTRSPWGAVSNSFDPQYISGGSSSGSAVTVATEQVYFSLGTDTAGSGRVPAAFNNLYGLKPTKGVVSCSGVVPACRTLDCVTFFTKCSQDLALLYKVGAQYDSDDCYARPVEQPSQSQSHSFKGTRVGALTEKHLQFFGDEEYKKLYAQAVARVESLGATVIPFDFEPFQNAANLLYQGPWVAERYAAIEEFYQQKGAECLEVIQTIVGGAKSLLASEAYKAMYQLQAYKVQCDRLMADVDVVLTPTAGTIYTIDDVEANPIELNSNLGYYTNFMNLLDCSALAMPAGFTQTGLPFGVTLFSHAFNDESLLSLAHHWEQVMNLPLGATGRSLPNVETMDLLVCGAHMKDLALNHQMIELGANLKQSTLTSSNYSLYCLAGGPPLRPGLVRNEDNGQAIAVEVWRMPKNKVGALLAQIPHPLGLGTVELESGEWVKGFICESIGLVGAKEITHFGGWRKFLAQSA
jgi:allophanate hydrolase